MLQTFGKLKSKRKRTVDIFLTFRNNFFVEKFRKTERHETAHRHRPRQRQEVRV